MHPDDESLAVFAEYPNRGPEWVAAHVESCAECAGFVQNLRELDSILSSNADAWAYADERAVVSGAPDELLDALRTRVAEDEEAERLLAPLLRDPYTFLWNDLTAKSRFLTAGVVRKLCDQVLKTYDNDASHAHDLAEAALLLTEALDTTRYSVTERLSLRGLALKARGIAYRKLGRFNDALADLDRARVELMRISSSTMSLADVAHSRADVLSAMGRFDEAALEAETAARRFAEQRRTRRYLHAMTLNGVIEFRRRNFDAARNIWVPLLKQAEADNDAPMIANLSMNIGAACVELGLLALASQHLYAADAAWTALGNPSEAARTKWSLAKILVLEGRFSEAADRLAQVQERFAALKAADDTALVRLQRVEALLLAVRKKEAESICRGLVQELMDLGLRPAAYKALAYVQELAAKGRLRVEAVRSAGQFLRALRENPTLTFVPPT